jgi:predicted ATP-grasp superfamily ATP-dependent carboligase
MQIFVYEYTTGGGLLADGPDSADRSSLVPEGLAMVQAVANDFAALDGIEVVTLHDVCRAPSLNVKGRTCKVANAADERPLFERLARESAWTLVIAPEMRGALAARCELVGRANGRVLNGTSYAIALAADKHDLARHLARHGLPAAAGVRVGAGQPWPIDFQLPAVIKPCDGAGSLGVRLIADPSELAGLPRPKCDQRLETYYPGLPASVGLLCGPKGNLGLPACRQRLGGVTGFEYQGGSLPLEPHLAERARSLAQRTAAALPGLLGFVGVDLILGPAGDGSQDCVIEVNPRLTTSYVGLRAAAQQNLAGALLAIAEGREAQLSFAADALRFSSDGRIDRPGGSKTICRTQFEAHRI